MRAPGECTADGCECSPAGEQDAGCGDFPVKAAGDGNEAEAFVIGERRQVGGEVDAGESLIAELRWRWRHDGVSGAINDEAITEVENAAAIVPPGTTTADLIS